MLRAQATRNGPITLAQSGVASSVTGTTAETTLASVTIPGGMMGANGVIRVSTLWSTTNNANNKFLRVSFGGTYYLSFTGTTSSSVQMQANIRNRNSTASQVGLGVGNSGFGGVTTAAATSTADTQSDQTLTIRAQLATTTDTITLEGYTVEVLPA